MIDEIVFSTRFSSLWSTLTPTMEHFVRSVNLSFYERYESEITSNIQPNERAVASEAAHMALARHLVIGQTEALPAILHTSSKGILADAVTRISKLRGEELQITTDETALLKEILDLAEALRIYLLHYENIDNTQPSPSFPGAGYIDFCTGDLLCDGTLIEIKNVDRNFRAKDFRQLLTYAALDYSSSNRRISDCALVNGRRGIYWKGSIDEFSRHCSGRMANELLEDILHAISSGDLSR